MQVTGQAIGPVLSGALRDLTGSYQVSLEVFAVLALSAVTCILFLRPTRRKAPEQP